MASKFYKILLDASSPHLPLPPAFVNEHLENTGPITISARGGYSWELRIEQIGDSVCFTDGWENVVQDIQLDYADFLLFKTVDQVTFEMLVYSPNGCDKVFPPKGEGDGGGGVDADVVGEFGNLVVDDEALNTNQPSGSSPSPVCVGLDEDEDDEEDDDPSFSLIITTTHKCMLRFPPEFMALIGKDGDDETMTVKTVDGKEWMLGLKMENSKGTIRYYLSSGWSNFRRENDLSDGDKCVFKFLRSEGKLLLANVAKVEIPVAKRKRGRPAKVTKKKAM